MPAVCSHCGEPLIGKRRHAEYCDSTCRADACRTRKELQGDEKALRSAASAGSGSHGGNVRSVQEARGLQSGSKDKRDWAGAIDEQIARTLIATGYFHADDLDALEVPPEHCNLKGTRAAWFRNKRFMESTDVYRKVSHPAANGRKQPIYRITTKGRRELAGHRAGGRGPANAAPSSVSGDQTAPVDTLAPVQAEGSCRTQVRDSVDTTGEGSPAVPSQAAGESRPTLFDAGEVPKQGPRSAQRDPEETGRRAA